MQPSPWDDPREARFIQDCLSTGIPLAEAEAMLTAHRKLNPVHTAAPDTPKAPRVAGGPDS